MMMKDKIHRFSLGLLLACLVIPSISMAQDEANSGMEDAGEAPQPVAPVYVIPIKGQIENALLYVIRRGLAKAEETQARAIVFEMHTPGGAVNTTEEIVDLLTKLTVPTYTFVERNAISAGAIIALATDFIYMTPGSKIGDAMPIVMGQQLDEAEREKAESYVAGFVRGIAEQKGRDPQLAESMVRKDIEYKVGEDIICPAGQVLTLTNMEAEKLYDIDGEQRPLLSAGTVKDFDEFMEKAGLTGSEIIRLEVTALEEVARFIAAMAPFLMGLGFLALYLEFQTPGIGWGAIVGAIALALFFFGHHIAGLAGQEEILIFALGIALILLEVFIIPGFGIAGIAGTCLAAWALIIAMVPHFPTDPYYPSLPALKVPFLNLGSAIIGAGVVSVLAVRFLPGTKTFNRLVLSNATNREEGFTASKDRQDMVGLTGEALTPLRTSGSMMVDDRKLSVVTRGEFIEQGTKLRIVEAHGNRIIVEPQDD